MSGKLRIGTSGWHYRDWVGRFYPKNVAPAKFLPYYCRFYDTVELNGVFYRLPEPETVKNWYRLSPKNFIFSYKASRFITHIKKLKDPEKPLHVMYERADLLKEKLGPILFQLPPSWSVDVEQLKIFLEALPRGYDHVMEFRHASWFTEEVYALLEKHGISLCLYDMKSERSPERFTSKLAYLRMHGSEGKYTGGYPKETLQSWAVKIHRWMKAGRRVFVYFNNDIQGHAIQNADVLKQFF